MTPGEIVVVLELACGSGQLSFRLAGCVLLWVSSPVIKCKKTPRKKCSFVSEEAKKR